MAGLARVKIFSGEGATQGMTWQDGTVKGNEADTARYRIDVGLKGNMGRCKGKEEASEKRGPVPAKIYQGGDRTGSEPADSPNSTPLLSFRALA